MYAALNYLPLLYFICQYMTDWKYCLQPCGTSYEEGIGLCLLLFIKYVGLSTAYFNGT